MAKGNLFLGMGRGSVGDVVFYRANGQQLSRARNRAPRNPKSDAQLIQRAISATISQAYKAGAIIFDHAFEGKSVPSGNHRQFLSVNMRKLRSQVLAELNTPAAEALSSVVSPRSTFPIPNSYRISEGSLIQNLFVLDAEDNFGPCAKVVAAASANETLAEYCSRLGLEAGEIFTIVTFGVPDNNSVNDLVSPQCTFGFLRLTIKETALTSTTLVSAAKYSDMFIEDSSGAVLADNKALTESIYISEIDIAFSGIGSMGVIRSNENSGLRSTSDMKTLLQVDEGSPNTWGVKPINLIEAWSEEGSQIDSRLILEGGDI